MRSYLNIVSDVLEHGKWKKPVRHQADGTAVELANDTIALPNQLFSHDMKNGFPLLTTKKMPLRTILVELEGFIKGITDKQWYSDRGCNIWREWSNPLTTPNWFSKEQKAEHQLKDTDLGRIYGSQWRSFNSLNKPTPRNIDGIIPTVFGVGVVLGNSKFNLDLKSTWYGMLSRCYNQNDKDYPTYGGKGVYVANRWLTYEYFEEDSMRLPGWGNKKEDSNEYTLDKDKSGTKCYGPNTCSWLSKKEQALYKSSVRPIYALSPDNDVYIYRSIKECANDRWLDVTAISHCISGKQDSHKGWQFWRDLPDEEENHVDQLKTIVDTLHKNPYDRRMVCSAWNPNQIDQMALPPCHWGWNVTVIDEEINLFWVQRSCDLMLGVPFNIASYAALLMLLAKESGFKPGNLSGMLVDCHIYRNHIDGAHEQLKREPKALPTLNIKDRNGKFSIFDWEANDVELISYDSHPKIKFGEVTV